LLAESDFVELVLDSDFEELSLDDDALESPLLLSLFERFEGPEYKSGLPATALEDEAAATDHAAGFVLAALRALPERLLRDPLLALKFARLSRILRRAR
jgi:hypothetical protein